MRLPWRKPEPAWEPEPEAAIEPAPRIVSTRVEIDLADIEVTPAMIEPSAYLRRLALDNAGLFQAYMSVGFHRGEAFQLLQQQLDAVMHRGHQ